MRIAMFSDSYKPQINGVVTQIENISLELGKKGNDFLIVAPSPSRKTIRKKEGKIKKHPRSPYENTRSVFRRDGRPSRLMYWS